MERNEQLAARQFDNGTETELIGIVAAGGKPVFCLNGHGDAIAPALHELILKAELDRTQIEVLVDRLVGRDCG
jgi:hypothetical protein